MIFTETPIPGAMVIEPSPIHDERGFFARLFSADLFEQHGLVGTFVQHNLSLSKTKGTLRGMHFQHPPHQEDKLVRCVRGSLYDVVLDLRPDSKTYLQSYGIILTPENRKMLYIPKGCAHGFQTLEEETEVFYLISQYYNPDAQGGVRWNDPAIQIDWPLEPTVLSEKDRNCPDYQPLKPAHC